MLNGAFNVARGLPATTILRLNADRRVESRGQVEIDADEVILAAVTHPPRIGEMRPIASLIPDVLARYGLSDAATSAMPGTAYPTANDQVSTDVFA